MNSIEKQKHALSIFGLVLLILAIIAFVGAVLLVVFGSISLSKTMYVAGGLELGFGILLLFGSVIGLVYGITSIWTSSYLKAVNGSIAEDNLGKGTVNMTKCLNCGSEITSKDKSCPNCGKSLATKKVCPSCGKDNRTNSKHCTNCGTDLK